MSIINNYLTIYGKTTDIIPCINYIRELLKIPLTDNFKNLDIIMVSCDLQLNYLHLTSINYDITNWLLNVSDKFTNLYFNLVICDGGNYETYTLRSGILSTETASGKGDTIASNSDSDSVNANVSGSKKPSETEFLYHHLLGHPFG